VLLGVDPGEDLLLLVLVHAAPVRVVEQRLDRGVQGGACKQREKEREGCSGVVDVVE
jgi:hypothetical protein